MKTASKINMKSATTHDTMIMTLTMVFICFLLELSAGELIDPGGPFGKCNLVFPGKKEELGNFLRTSGTSPDRSFCEALKFWSPFGMLLGRGKGSWPLVHNNLHKELGLWHDECANIFGGYGCFYQIKQSLLIDHVSMVGVLLRRDD